MQQREVQRLQGPRCASRLDAGEDGRLLVVPGRRGVGDVGDAHLVGRCGFPVVAGAVRTRGRFGGVLWRVTMRGRRVWSSGALQEAIT